VALSSGMFLAQGRIREAIRTGQGALSLDELDLAALPESLGGLTALTELYLQGNQLTALPEWLGGLTALTGLILRGNPLVSPPGDVVAARSDAAMAVNPASASSSMGVGTAGSFSHPATSHRLWPELAAARNRGGEQVLGGPAPDVAAVLVGDGEHEVPGEAVGFLDGPQPVQQVPPPGLRLVGDVLRVEQPHVPAGGGADRRGGGPQVGLVGGGDDGAGGGQHERDRVAGGLA